MARIRSVHPATWTDAHFVSMSMAARLLFIGLWNEADDQGVFAWKPLDLKIRLMPVDHVEIGDLLKEMIKADRIRSYQVNGRQFGVIRNFTKYQRPKSPKSIHPLPDQFRKFAGLDGDISEIDDDEEPPRPLEGEIIPQREEGGDNMEEGGDSTSLRSVVQLASAVARKPKGRTAKVKTALPDGWLPDEQDQRYAADQGLDAASIIRETAKFIDRQRMHNGAYADWRAAWRNWISGGIEKGWIRSGSPSQSSKSVTDLLAEKKVRENELIAGNG